MIRIYIILSFLLFGIKSFSQTISGPTSVTVGQVATYTLTDDIIYCDWWEAIGGSVGLKSRVGLVYSVSIAWNVEGSGSVKFIDDCAGGIIAFLSVNITNSCASPPAPIISSFTLATVMCGTRSLSYTNTKPLNVTWYWQTTATGTSTLNSTKNYSAPVTGIYYVRAKADCGNFWSSSSASTGTVTVNPLPAIPTVPTVSTNACGTKTLTKTGTAPTGTTWFWQGTILNGKDNTSATATSNTYPVATHGTSTHYIASRNNTTGCWSDTRSVAVTVNNPPVPTNTSQSTCEWNPTTLYVYSPVGMTKWYSATDVFLYSGSYYTLPSQLNAGTHTYRARGVSGTCESSYYATVTVNVGNSSMCDNQLNWQESKVYGINTDSTLKEIGSSKTYSDLFGNAVQAQSKSYTTNQVLATQSINDSDGSAVISTLPAPINSSTFSYRHRFVTDNDAIQNKYGANDFDLTTNTGAVGEVKNPKPVGINGVGSLGWYYSSSNTSEPLTPTTGFPYSRSWSEKGPDADSSVAAGPGDAYRLGAAHEAKSQRLKISSGELDHYYSLRSHFVSTTPSYNVNLLAAVNRYDATHFSASQNVSVVFNGGAIMVTCNQATSTPGVQPIGGTIAVTPLKKYTLYLKGYQQSSQVRLYVANAAGGDIVWPGAALPTGSNKEGWVSCSFTVPAGVTSIKVGALWSTPTVGDKFYITAIDLRAEVPTTSIGYKFVATDADGKKSATFVDHDGRELAKALITNPTTTTNPPVYTYDYWSYSYYNDLSQLVATVAPNGVNTASTAYPNFVTSYKYDHLGQLIETSSIDEGTSNYVYSLDGKIRFSQNQEQRNASSKRFSYTNYDFLGRLIESGEYIQSGTGFYVFETVSAAAPVSNSLLSIVDSIDYTGVTRRKNNSTATRYSDTTFIDYDFVAPDFVSDVNHTVQQNLIGQVSRTKNAEGTTWYSYDEFGQVTWSKQSINGLGYKTVDYTYDYLGNVTQVVYQKGQTDAFYHHYAYDADQRLSIVETSKNGTTKTLHAKYYYYLHGPLKRVELANNKQGIDYTYTISGALKGINHSDPVNDPGQDGIGGANASFAKDAFGQTLHYYDNDFTGSNYAKANIAVSGFNNQYSGNVKAISYNSPVDVNAKHVYAYQYNTFNQLSNAQWGDVTDSAGSYTGAIGTKQREQIPAYDKNGNIQSLTRTGKSSQTLANYNYVYEANTNKLDKVNHNSVLMTDYTYNAIGQMTQQVEGTETTKVIYNAYGLTKEIRNGSNRLVISYHYDDRGDLVRKTYYTDDAANAGAKNVFYVLDASGNTLAIYEQALPGGTVQLVELPIYGSGKVATYKPPVNVYFYEVNDHLGNVRAVIGVTETETFTATMESENVATEQPPFTNITNTRVAFTAANKTTGGNEVTRLNNLKPAGPAIGLEVYPGDKINMSTWAYYEAGSSNFSSSLSESVMLAAIGGAFGGISGAAGEAGQIYNNVTSGFAGTVGSSGSSSLPSAFLTYVLYDKNFVRITWGSKGVTPAGNMAKEQLVIPELIITEPGFLYVCLYNRSDNVNPVYFDQFVVSAQHTAIVAGADYYPFGMVQDTREITREDYRYGYQGQYAEKDTTNNWNQFELRFYDAKIARWLSADPYGQYYSPYLAMGNAPNKKIDPNGGFADDILLNAVVITASRLPSIASIASIAGGVAASVGSNLVSNGLSKSFCPNCPDPQWAELPKGTSHTFQDGTEYILDDPSKGRDGWTRNGGQMNEIVVTPSKTFWSSVKRFGAGMINPLVDVVTTTWTSTRNGFKEYANGQGKYDQWHSYKIDEEGFYRYSDKNGFIPSGPERSLELISNTIQTNLMIYELALPALPVSYSNSLLQGAGDFAVKTYVGDVSGKAIDNALSVH